MAGHDTLSAACAVLDMEKPAAVAPAAAQGGLGALWRSMPGWGRALAIAAPAAAGGALVAGGGDNRAQLAAMLKKLRAARSQFAGSEETAFSPFEQRMFTRHGLDPKRLQFMKTLGKFRSGMELESELLNKALSGQAEPEAPGGALEQYA